MIIGISGKKQSGKDLSGAIIPMLIQGNSIVEILNDIQQDVNTMSDEWQIVKFADKLKDCVCLIIGCTREQLENEEFKNKELGEEWWYYKLENSSIYVIPKLISYLEADYPENQKKVLNDYLIKLTPRLLLQLLGTECGRQIIHPNIWINATMAGYIKLPIERYDKSTKILKTFENIRIEYEYPNWLITDTRFPNEAQAIKDKSGIVIRINRDDSLRYPTQWTKYVDFNQGRQLKMSFTEWLLIDDIELYKVVTHRSETGLDDYKDFDYVIENNGTLEELIIKLKDILIKEKII